MKTLFAHDKNASPIKSLSISRTADTIFIVLSFGRVLVEKSLTGCSLFCRAVSLFIRDEISDDRVEEVHLEAALPALLITAIIIIMTIQPIIIGIKTDSREGRSISELMRVFAA